MGQSLKDDLLDNDLKFLAERLLVALATEKAKIAVAESCTGGLLAAHLTDFEGYGHCFERGFVSYAEQAKCEQLGIALIDLKRHDPVSAEIARQMVQGALNGSQADVAVATTGFAGAGGPFDEEGLVHIAAMRRGARLYLRECHFGALGRERIRALAVRAALELSFEALAGGNGRTQGKIAL